MGIMDKIWVNAKANKKTIALPEASESRTLNAAKKITQEGLANIVLVGNTDKIKVSAKKEGIDLDEFKIEDPSKSEKFDSYVDTFFILRKNKGISQNEAKSLMSDPIYFATMMVKKGDVDGMVSGAVHSTGDLLRPALQIIKTAPGISIVSSCFVMELTDTEIGDNGIILFADCAINLNPNAEELASIAIATASTAKSLCNIEPRIAMLSFSTKGSGKSELVDKVVKATELAKEKAPDLLIDGELQLDAAIVPKVASLKAPGSKVAGKANILIFPDLQSGNIGYKLVQRIAKANTIGPVSQGFAKPVNDLSRGCSVIDIVNVVAITSLQAS
jgi:phosphate acetyltransferase